jgi:TonB family protein
MTLHIRIKRPKTDWARWRALAISLAGHAAAFVALMHAPEIRLPQASPSEYQQAIAGREAKLVWYKFNNPLPDIDPLSAEAEPKPVRAEVEAHQQIVASPKNAPKQAQIVFVDAPVLPEIAPLESPNVLALKIPEIKPPARIFVPPDIVKPEPAKVEMPPDAPKIAVPALSVLVLPVPAKIVTQFVPPPRRVPVKLTEVAPPPETPTIADAVKPNTPPLDYALKLPARPFTAPRLQPTAEKQISVEAPPPVALNADALTAKNLNLAVVGLKPADRPAPLPTASSPGQFSAGPVIRPDGANSASEGKGLSVPDLFVSGAGVVSGTGSPKPDLIAQAFAAPTSGTTLREAMRTAAPGTVAPAPAPPPSRALQPGAIQVSGAPDPRFNGRETYMMAIQMPNLTSYSGSWLMWYADRTRPEAARSNAPVAPPVAWRKVDPKYVASAVTDRVEGKVRLACVIGTDGRVSTIELVNGLDDRLNQSAEEALAKWEFTPATRHGEPVEVDVLVEIPFKLEPHKPVSF